jgi:hypothetical protein
MVFYNFVPFYFKYLDVCDPMILRLENHPYTGFCFIQGSVYLGFTVPEYKAFVYLSTTFNTNYDRTFLTYYFPLSISPYYSCFRGEAHAPHAPSNSAPDDVGLVSGSVDTTAVVWRYTEGKVIC